MSLDIEINGRFAIRHTKQITRTPLGDSESPLIRLRCPSCGTFAEIDEDQYRGRVSVECSTAGCAFHETHNFAVLERQALCKDDPGGAYVESYEIEPAVVPASAPLNDGKALG